MSNNSLAVLPPLATSLLLLASSATDARPLQPYLWKNRPLLIFAPSESSSQLKRQRRIVATNHAGLRERDMIVIEIVGSRVRTVLGSTAAFSAAAARKFYGVGPGTFRTILVGKDGGRKLQSSSPIGSARLFRLIDAMPMRKQEIRRKGK